MTTPTPVLEAIGLRRESEDATVLLNDASLAVPPGSSTAIVGPPGAGKTLLLRALGLLDPLQSGEIRFRGRPIEDHEVPRVRRQVVLVAQRPVSIEGTVRDNLLLPFCFGPPTEGTLDDDRLLALISLLERDATFLDRDVKDLSGGESQLVALLRAIQLAPTVLLLDEPTSSLDAQTTGTVERLITDWHSADKERALVIVTHTRELASRLARRIVHVEFGSIISEEEHAGHSA